jgi:pimeloyl-ACP methyl ester carboxylesterase
MKVFVHGNPECDAIWDPLRATLADRGIDDVVALSPPGFGAAEARRCLVVVASEDAYVPATLSRDGAARVGARVLPLEGQGHGWMVHAANRAADGLARFWTELD